MSEGEWRCRYLTAAHDRAVPADTITLEGPAETQADITDAQENDIMSRHPLRSLTLTVLSIAVLLTGWLSEAQSAASEPKKGGTLRVGMFNDVTNIDPGVSINVVGLRIRNNIYETLLAWDDDMNPRPMLADSYEVSADGRLYTFHLRKGVTFHDGSNFTATDVKFSFERAAKVSPRRSDLSVIERIEVIDEHTVAFHLKNPSPVFLQAVCMWFFQITPKAHTEQQLQKYGEILEPVGTGPFKVVEWKRGQHVRLARYEGYKPRPEPASGLAGRKVAHLDEIVYIPIKDNSVRMLSLEQGEIDYAQQVPPEDMDRLDADPKIEVKSTPGTNWSVVYLNTVLAPTDKKAMRQAIAYAIDYDELNRAVFSGKGRVNHSIIPEIQTAWRTPEHKVGYKLDLPRVKRLLQEAGYGGEEILFETRNEPTYDLIAQNLQAQLKRAGINLKLNYLEGAAHTASVYVRSNQKKMPTWHMGLITNTAFRPDPDMQYYARGHSRFHLGFWKNEAFDAAVERARTVLDFGERRKLYAQAHTIQIDEVPLIVLLDEPYIDAYRTYVKGTESFDPYMDFYWNAWIEK